MLRVFKLLIAVLLLGGCYSQFKATKQVDKALAHYPQIVAKIALDSFPCDVIRIDTLISVRDSIIECLPIENFTTIVDTLVITKKVFAKLPIKTTYITKVVESTAKLTIINAHLDSVNNAIYELQKVKDELTGKVARKNKVIYWLIALIVGISIPYLFRIVRYITLY